MKTPSEYVEAAEMEAALALKNIREYPVAAQAQASVSTTYALLAQLSASLEREYVLDERWRAEL